MKKIWKFPLQMGMNKIDIPTGSKALMINHIEDNVFLWVECDPDSEPKEREILVLSTGQEVNPRSYDHLNSFVIHRYNEVYNGYVKNGS